MAKKLMRVDIVRDHWLRGTHYSALEFDGDMCCLGFVCKAYGVETIKDIPMPHDLPKVERKKLPAWLLKSNKLESPVEKVAQINDKISLDDDVREAELTKIFRQYGIAVKFI